MLVYIKITNQTYLIAPFLLFEIPTAILDLKKLYPKKSINIFFGTTFLIFRILYNLHLFFIVSEISRYYGLISICMLLVHIYWFIQWLHHKKSLQLPNRIGRPFSI